MLLFALLLAFLAGSIPTGFILAKLKGVDLRQVGSGNTGATNAGRVLGKKAGVLTLVIDFLKGIVGIRLGLAVLSASNTHIAIDPSSLLALTAICGHCFSPWLKFRGGKGVATGGGVFFYLVPIQAAISLLVFAVLFKFTKIVSLSSIIAAAVIPLLLFFSDVPGELRIVSLLSASLVIYRHKENIQRLLRGEEKKFSLGSG